MMKYGRAMSRLVPGAQWSCAGDDIYENYLWAGPGEQPSKAECDAIIATFDAEDTHDAVEKARRAAYQREADPIYFAVQRGEATEQDWLDKVAEIRGRYPYPS